MKKHILRTSMLSFTTAVVLGLTACSGGGGDSSTTTTASTSAGGAVDGYLQGATVFVDTTGDGEQNATEQSVITNTNGDFTLTGTIANGTKVYASGGIDRSTGLPFEGRLSAIYDSAQEVILSPLTTYVAALVDRNMSIDDATALVAANLGIDPANVHKDPMTIPEAFLASQKVQKTIEVVAAATNTEGDFNKAYENVFTSLALVTENNASGGDFNATALVSQAASDSGVTVDASVTTFLETYVTTVDDLADQNVSVNDLDAYGEILNTYTEVAEGAIENNETLDTVQSAIEDLNVTEVVTNVEDNNYTDPMVDALAEVESALDNNISYLGTNTADNNITADLLLSDPSAAPFDTNDLNLSWSSNSAFLTISGTTGAVVRDNLEDKEVQLKATVNNALVINSRTFDLVIKRMEYTPVAGDNNVTITEDTPSDINFTAVISDLNNDALTITAVGDASHGTVTLSNGVVTYAPALNYNGSDSFSYTVTDSTGRSATGVVNVTVTAVDDATVWHTTSNLGTKLEDFGSFTVTLDASDVDGNVTYSLVSYTAGVTATLSDANLTISSVANAYGSQEIVVAASEGGVDTNLTLTLDITAVDDATVWNNTPSTLVAVDEDFTSAVTVDLNATDVDSNVTYSIVSNNGIVDANLSGATLTLTAKENVNGTAEIVLAANGVEHTISMVVNSVNDAPVAPSNDLTLSVKVDNTLSGQLNASDVDGDTLTFSNASVTDGNITLESNGLFTYTAGSSDGNVTFTYDVSDSNITVSAEQIIGVVLSDPPVANPESVTLNEDTNVSIDVLANDTDDNNATLTIISATASNGTVTIETNATLTYVPNTNFNGTDTISYVIEDPDGGQASADVNITVLAVNDAPVIAPINDVTVAEDSGVYSLDVNITDVDTNASNIIMSVASSDTNIATVAANGTELQITPITNMDGNVTITVAVSDGENNDTLAFIFSITPVNDVPIIINDTFSVLAGTTATLDILDNDTDADGDFLTISDCNTTDINGSVSIDNNGTILSYVADANFEGTESFTCQVTDGTVSVDENVTVVVSNNQPPVVTNVALTMLVGETITGQIQAYDPDDDNLTFSPLSLTSDLNATLTADGNYSITALEAGAGEIVVNVSDGTNDVLVTYTIAITYSQKNIDSYDVSDGSSLTSDEFDALANTTHDAIPADTKLYSAWGSNYNWDTNTTTLDSDYIEFQLGGTFIISEDNESTYTHDGNLDGITEVFIDDNGNDINVADIIMIDANMSATDIEAEVPTLAMLSLPRGAVVYKMAVRMEQDEYSVWGPAEDCTNGCTAYNSLSEMIDSNASGIITNNELNHNRFLVFGLNETFESNNSSGNVVEVDMTGVYAGTASEPVVVNPNAGTWTAALYNDDANSDLDMVVVTVADGVSGYDKHPILVDNGFVDDNGNTNSSVMQGDYTPAGDAAYEYRFNDVVNATIQNYYAPLTIDAWISDVQDANNTDLNTSTFDDVIGLNVDIVANSPLYELYIDRQYQQPSHFETYSLAFDSSGNLAIDVFKDGIYDANASEALTYDVDSSDNSITAYRVIDGTTTAIYRMKIVEENNATEIQGALGLYVPDNAAIYLTAGLQLIDEVYYDNEENATAYAADGILTTGFTSVDDFISTVADNSLGFAFSYDGNNTLTLDNSSDANVSGRVIQVNLDDNSTTDVGGWEVTSVVAGTTTENTLIINLDDNVSGYDDDMAFGMNGGSVLLRGNMDFEGEGGFSYMSNSVAADMIQANFDNQILTPFTYEELADLILYGVSDAGGTFVIQYGSYYNLTREIEFNTFTFDGNQIRQNYVIVDGTIIAYNEDGSIAATITRIDRNDMFSYVRVNNSFNTLLFYNINDAIDFSNGLLNIEP